jgi:hypothetical protein
LSVYAGASIVAEGTTNSVSPTTGSLLTAGGLGVAKNKYVNTAAIAASAQLSTNYNQGSLVTAGGVGVKKSIFTGGQAVFGINNPASVADGHNSVKDVMRLGHTLTSGAAANGIGVGISVAVDALAGLAERFRIETTYNTATNGAEDSTMTFKGMAIGNMVTSFTITDSTKFAANPTTVATTSTSGALTVVGGSSVVEDLYVGGIVATAWTSGDDSYSSYSSTGGSLLAKGGLGVAKNIYAGTLLVSESQEVAEDATEGAVVTAGGATFSSQVYTGGVWVCKSAQASTSSTTGSLLSIGGVGIAGDLYAGGSIVTEHSSGTGVAASASSGALQTAGGLGVVQNLYAGGAVVLTGTTPSTNIVSGTIVTKGGISAAKSVTLGSQYVAGFIHDNVHNAITNTMVLSHTTSGTPAAGIGVGINVAIEDQGDIQKCAGWTFQLDDVTQGSEDTSSTVVVMESGTMVTALDFTGNVFAVRDSLRFGSAGTVSQATDINTGVTLNKESGVITTQAATTAAHGCDAFVVTNSKVLSTSAVFVSMGSYSGSLIIENPATAKVS